MAQRTGRAMLTARGIASLPVGSWAADPAPRGVGVLQVRKLEDGKAAFYYRYTGADQKRYRLPIGTDIGLASARRRVLDLSARYQAGDRNLREILEEEGNERERQRLAAQAAALAATATRLATLGALLEAYVEQLKRQGKPSSVSVEGTIRRHVREAWPQMWLKSANGITLEDLLSILSRVAETGKLREAAKLRSYLNAAFAAAIRSRQDAVGIPALRELKITHNPARDLVTIEGASQARNRVLNEEELRAYWAHISGMHDVDGALLRFHLLTGAQRMEQLSRLTLEDFDPDQKVIRMQDPKGRRRQARNHIVPLIPSAIDAMAAMGHEIGIYLVTVTNGVTGAAPSSIALRVRRVSTTLCASEKVKSPFTPGDLRRTVETRLAAAGVQKDIRAQLQSHGLSGVQARHYDRHDYLDEKRAALETLHGLVVGAKAKASEARSKGR